MYFRVCVCSHRCTVKCTDNLTGFGVAQIDSTNRSSFRTGLMSGICCELNRYTKLQTDVLQK